MFPVSQGKFLPSNVNITINLLTRRKYLPSFPSFLVPGKLHQTYHFLLIYFQELKLLTQGQNFVTLQFLCHPCDSEYCNLL